MGDWLDLHAVYVNEWMRRKWLEFDMSYNVYVHYKSSPLRMQAKHSSRKGKSTIGL